MCVLIKFKLNLRDIWGVRDVEFLELRSGRLYSETGDLLTLTCQLAALCYSRQF